MKTLILSADHFDDPDPQFPFCQLKEEGFEVDIASILQNGIKA